MPPRNHTRTAGVLLAALTAILASTAQAQTPVTIGTTNTAADVGNFIADRRGYFAAEGLKVQFVRFDAAARMIAPMASGELDVGGGGISAGLFNAVARGIALKIVADRSTAIRGHGNAGVLVRKALIDSGAYKKPQDLKGRKVALPAPGSGTSTAIDRWLKPMGMSINDFDLTYLSFPQTVAAIQSGAIDAGFLAEPGMTTVIASNAAVRIVTDDEMFPGHQIAVTLFSEKFIKAPGNVAVRFMKAFLRGTRDYNDAVRNGKLAGPGADGVIGILTEYSVFKDPAIWRKIVVHGCDPDGKLDPKSLQVDLDYFTAQGLIQGKVTLAQAIDTSIAEAAVRDLGPYKRK